MGKALSILAAILMAGGVHAGETCVFVNNHAGMDLTVKTRTRLSTRLEFRVFQS